VAYEQPREKRGTRALMSYTLSTAGPTTVAFCWGCPAVKDEVVSSVVLSVVWEPLDSSKTLVIDP
jgi:hypothetical protein